eukprot:m.67480 g.67480  ORF g.67480 m.67480 type:complete len:663 (+) comp9868_c2_seq1:515-2503(+)
MTDRESKAGAAVAPTGPTSGSSLNSSEELPIELSTDPMRFAPVNATTSVFFDETNKQVFVVSEGSPDLLVKSLDSDEEEAIPLGRGPVISVKFSLDHRVLSIQRTSRTVVFHNRGAGLDPAEYSQSCKSKLSSHLLGFVWTGTREVAFITSLGLEYYAVNPEKRSLKLIKSYSISVNWYVYSHENRVLLLSTALQANQLQPYLFKDGGVTRLSKFEVELPAAYNQLSPKLLERDVYLAPLYQRLYCMVVRNKPRGGPAEITLLRLTRDTTTRVAVLALDQSGRFAINTVDNLILVHHQISKSTCIFDLKWSTVGRDGNYLDGHSVEVLHPMMRPRSIAAPPRHNDDTVSRTNLYSSSWIVFQPDIVIDARLGYLWTLHFNLDRMAELIPSKTKLLKFLLRRGDAKETILRVIFDAIKPETQCELGVISQMFDQINHIYARRLLGSTTPQGIILPQLGSEAIAVNQSDMYKGVFLALEDTKIKYQFMVKVLVDYIRSLSYFGVTVEHFLYELVINLLVRHNRYYQLHQFLQYHVINDSKPVACLLLSLESKYPPAFQLALDMLKRLATANEEIVDVLVGKDQLLLALRFLRSLGPEAVATVSPRRFLEAAYNTGDSSLFYIVYKFFEERNVTLRKRPEFRKGEECEAFVAHFNKLFNQQITVD